VAFDYVLGLIPVFIFIQITPGPSEVAMVEM